MSTKPNGELKRWSTAAAVMADPGTARDEIHALLAENERLREALETCALMAEAIERTGEDCVPQSMRGKTAADIHATARAALQSR